MVFRNFSIVPWRVMKKAEFFSVKELPIWLTLIFKMTKYVRFVVKFITIEIY